MIFIICIIGLIVCEILENIMQEKDREKALGYEFKHYCSIKMEEGNE